MTTTQNAHIETLIRHGAKLRAKDQLIDLTEQFYQDTVERCNKDGFNAITYDLVMPGIEEDLMLAIWKDGHADSGNVRSVCACLDR